MKVVFDLEANGLLGDADTIWCGVFKDVETGEVQKWSQEKLIGIELKDVIGKTLDKCDAIAGHNIVDYDIPLLEKVFGYEVKDTVTVIDTFILSQMLDPDRRKHPDCKKGGHSLENFGCIYGRAKPEHEDWSKYTEGMLHRCSEDVEINYLVYKNFMREIADYPAWSRPLRMETAFGKCLVKQKKKGFLVDKGLMKRHIRYLTERIDRIDEEAVPMLPLKIHVKESKKDGVYGWLKKPFKKNGEPCEYCLAYIDAHYPTERDFISGPFSRIRIDPFDLGKIEPIKHYLLAEGWVPDEWNYKKGLKKEVANRTSPKLTKEDSFLGVKSDVGKLVAQRMVFRHRRSQLEGFLKLIRPDGRIAAEVSGICPTVRLRHKGIVNVPGVDAEFGSQMREVFIAPEGYRIVGCDASSCQLRMLAHYMGDAEYTKAVLYGKQEDGTDVHSVNMRLAGLSSRAQAKTFIYAFLFGAGLANLAAQLGLTIPETRKKIAQFLKGLPKLKALVDNIKVVWKKRGYLIGLDGRKIFVRSEHMLLVYLLQSAEAIMMKVSTCYADKWITQRGLDAAMIAHIHDEYQLEVNISQAHEVGELLELAMVKAGEYLGLTVPMSGEHKIGLNWKETH